MASKIEMFYYCTSIFAKYKKTFLKMKKKETTLFKKVDLGFLNTLDQYHICFPVLEAWVRVVLEAG